MSLWDIHSLYRVRHVQDLPSFFFITLKRLGLGFRIRTSSSFQKCNYIQGVPAERKEIEHNHRLGYTSQTNYFSKPKEINQYSVIYR